MTGEGAALQRVSGLQIVFLPRFPYGQVWHERKDAIYENTEAVVRRWSGMFGDCIRSADYEDWHEPAHILLTAIDSGMPVYAMDFERTGNPVRSFNTTRDFPEHDAPTIVLGMTESARFSRNGAHDLGLNVVWPIRIEIRDAAQYHLNAGFLRNSGRACAVGISDDSVPADSAQSLISAVQLVARQALGKPILLKCVARVKYSGLTEISVQDAEDRTAIDRVLMDALGYDLIHTDGIPEFLVQEKIRMLYEYRVVVIGGKVVCGAGCIEAHIPAHNSALFDPMMEVVRGDGIPRSYPGIRDRYRKFAEGVVSEIGGGSYTLDLAIGDNGEPLVIELNPPSQFGLYANDYAPILKRIIEYVGDTNDAA